MDRRRVAPTAHGRLFSAQPCCPLHRLQGTPATNPAPGQAPPRLGPGTRARRPVPENPPPTHPFRTHNLSMISDRGHGQHASARGVTAIEHVVVLMEKAIAAMRAVGTTSSKFVIVFHFEGFSWYDCDPRLASAFVSLIGQQYPERLHRLVLVDAPFLFEPTWGLVRGTMPPTRPFFRTHVLIPSVRGTTTAAAGLTRGDRPKDRVRQDRGADPGRRAGRRARRPPRGHCAGADRGGQAKLTVQAHKQKKKAHPVQLVTDVTICYRRNSFGNVRRPKSQNEKSIPELSRNMTAIDVQTGPWGSVSGDWNPIVSVQRRTDDR